MNQSPILIGSNSSLFGRDMSYVRGSIQWVLGRVKPTSATHAHNPRLIAHDEEESKTMQQVLFGPQAKEWFETIKEDINSMESNRVWDLVDLLLGRKTIENKWVLNIKHKADGTIDRYKAQLVAKGYTQQEGIDYEETFSPVVRFASIRLILAIMARMDLELYQMDIKTVFLNGELDEEIHMDQPLGFELKG